MKHLLAVATVFLAFIATSTAQNTSTLANDFNYTFYPAPTYKKTLISHVFDSLTNDFVQKRDSSYQSGMFVVEKVNNHIAIRNLQNVSEILYESNVRYLGIDALARMKYQAMTQDGEIISVNPMLGIAIIEWRNCVEQPQKGRTDIVKKYCNVVGHTFGGIIPSSPPASPPPATKPK